LPKRFKRKEGARISLSDQGNDDDMMIKTSPCPFPFKGREDVERHERTPFDLLSLFVLALARSLARNTAIADDHHQKHPTLSEARLLDGPHSPD
jgi:hypothetical protein